MGEQWVLVVTTEGATSPSVIGPFDDVDVAAKAGKILQAGWLDVKLATINPYPERLMEKLKSKEN